MIGYNNIRLEKGMYDNPNKSFTQILESLDPSENYNGTALEGLDAYQRQLKRFDIHAKGVGSDAVEKFFRTTESAVLFPEYIARSVKCGMEENNILSHITAVTSKIDCMDYRSISSALHSSEQSHQKVDVDTYIPQTEVHSRENLVKLHKRGRMLVASYENICYQRLNLFSVVLRQIGNSIMRMHLKDAIDVLVDGDGNDNAAEIFYVDDNVIGGRSGILDYNNLLKFWSRFDPYTMNTLLASTDVIIELLQCQEFQNPLNYLNIDGVSELANPLGLNIIQTSALSDGTMIGLDKNYALEMVKASDVVVDHDMLIDRRFEMSSITSIMGFAKIFKEASKVLEVK